MRKPMSRKKLAVKRLRYCIRQSRKIARQINRKLETLAALNKARAAAQQELIDIMGLK